MIRIEQQAEAVKLSFEFQTNAEICGIRLVSANVSRTDFVLGEAGGMLASGLVFRPADRGRDQQHVTFAVEFDFRIWSGQGDDKRDLARIRCKFDADYDLNPGFDPAEAQMAAFHHGNAIFNCWPYFREFVQNTTVRMDLPPATIPFLRLVPKARPKVLDAESPQAIASPPAVPAKRISGPSAKSAKKKAE